MRRDSIRFAGRNTAIALAALYDIYSKRATAGCELRASNGLLAALHKAGIVYSVRGRGGGIFLPSKFDEMTLLDLVKVAEPTCDFAHESTELLDIVFRRVLRTTKIIDLFPEIPADPES